MTKYTDILYKKDLNDQDNYDGVITHLDILEGEVKRALGSITWNKSSGDFGIPTELFQILKDDAVKYCTQYASKCGKLYNGHRTGKVNFCSNPKAGQCQTMFKIPHKITRFTC